MGGWQLEVGKMAFYLAFPVVIFHFFNQPAYFEEWVIKTKRNIYPPEDPDQKVIMEATKAQIRKKINDEILAAIQLNDAKNS